MKMIKKAKKGFTLIELVVVIAVIAILSGVSVVAYVGITNNAKKSAAQTAATQIVTTIRAGVLASSEGYDETEGVPNNGKEKTAADFEEYPYHFDLDGKALVYKASKGETPERDIKAAIVDMLNELGEPDLAKETIFVDQITEGTGEAEKLVATEIGVLIQGKDSGDKSNYVFAAF